MGRALVQALSSKYEIQHGGKIKTPSFVKEVEFARRSFDFAKSLEVVLVIALPLLLILAGDVELNPGPVQKGPPTHQALCKELESVAADWFKFGLYLGVEHGDLKIIEKDHPTDTKRCQIELLALWLQSKSSPTWKDIVQALQKINDTRLANSIKLKYLSKGAYTPDPELHADGITLFESQPALDHAISLPNPSPSPDFHPDTPMAQDVVHSSAANSLGDLPTLGREVQSDSLARIAAPGEETDKADSSIVPKMAVSADHLSDEIASVSSLRSHKVPNVNSLPRLSSEEEPEMSSTPTSSDPPLVVQVDKKIAYILFELRVKFNHMFQDVEKAMKEGDQQSDHLEDLKQTVTDITEDDTFEKCKDYQSFFEKLRFYVDMFDPYVLSILAKEYADEQARSHIKHYSEYLEKFKQDTAIDKLQGALKLAREGCPLGASMSQIIMKLPPKWLTKTLKDLSDLTNNVFGIKSRVLQGPVEVEKGCVHVMWCVKEHLVRPLRDAATKKVDVLEREALILLRIGGVTLFQDGKLVKAQCGMPTAVSADQSKDGNVSMQQQEPLSPKEDRMLRTCSDISLMHVAHHITDWEALVKFFGLKDGSEDDLRKGGIPNHRLLWLWKEKEKEAATYHLLHQIFSRAGNVVLAKMVEEIVAGKSWHSPDFAWEAFRQYLRDCYSTSAMPLLGPSNMQEMPYIDCQLPVLLAEEGQERVKEIELGKLFQRSETSARLQRVLIEGVPGSGKTMLTWRACHQWAEGKLFPEFEVMIYISMADARVSTAGCFIGLIPHPSEEVCQVIAEVISSRSGRGCCIILDGWGDIPTSSHGAAVLLACLEGSAEGLVFPHGSILVTMRPMDQDRALYHIASSVVQLKGFTSTEVKQFIKKYFDKCKSSPEHLLASLLEQPSASALCHLPVNLANVAYLFTHAPCTFPSSQTELFERLIHTHMLRNLCQQRGKLSIWSPSEWSREDQKFYDAVCLLGYDSVSNSRHAYTASELEARGLEVQKLTAFGPLRDSQQLTWHSTERKYAFVHSTIQHFFCALHMKYQMNEVQQKNMLERIMFDCPSAPVAVYFSGLTKLCNDEAFLTLRDGFARSVPRSPMFPIARHSRWLLLNLVHCMCEADRMDLCRLVGPPPLFLSFSELLLSSYDSTVLGKFLASYCMHRKCHVNFEYCRMMEEELLLLMQPLIDAVVSRELRQCTLGINLDYNEVTLPVLECLRTVCLSSAIMELSLTSLSKHTNVVDGLQILQEGLALCSSEPRVSLSNCGFTVAHIPYVIPLLVDTQLRLLDLSYSQFHGGLMPLFQAIRANTSLRMLLLMAVGIDDNELIQLARELQHNSTLKSLALQRNDFSSPTFYQFLRIIGHPRLSRSVVNDLHADQEHINSLPESFDMPILIRDCVPVWW